VAALYNLGKAKGKIRVCGYACDREKGWEPRLIRGGKKMGDGLGAGEGTRAQKGSFSFSGDNIEGRERKKGERASRGEKDVEIK